MYLIALQSSEFLFDFQVNFIAGKFILYIYGLAS